jgi:hypothetical protein
VIWRWRTKIHGRTIAFTTSIRMGWSAKDQGSQHGSASEPVARVTILSQAIRPAPAGGQGRPRKSSAECPLRSHERTSGKTVQRVCSERQRRHRTRSARVRSQWSHRRKEGRVPRSHLRRASQGEGQGIRTSPRSRNTERTRDATRLRTPNDPRTRRATGKSEPTQAPRR